MESQELLTKSEVFQDQILAGTECGENPASEVSEPHDHGKNLTQVPPVEPVAKSLYLQVHHVLRTRSTPPKVLYIQLVQAHASMQF